MANLFLRRFSNNVANGSNIRMIKPIENTVNIAKRPLGKNSKLGIEPIKVPNYAPSFTGLKMPEVNTSKLVTLKNSFIKNTEILSSSIKTFFGKKQTILQEAIDKSPKMNKLKAKFLTAGIIFCSFIAGKEIFQLVKGSQNKKA